MIEIRNVVKEFDGFRALDGLNMTVPDGAVYGLVGPNGAGKSTIIRHLTGIYRQDSGDVLVDGEQVFENPAVKNRIAYIPDDIFYFSNARIGEMASFYRSIYPQFDSGRFKKLGEVFDLDPKRQMRKLSKGEKMDVRALLDEPYFIHGSTNIDGLLPVMSKKRLNMAVVTDNYGGTLGIVTVEDILEELVGEIWDEDDVVEEPYVALDNGEWDCTAEMTVSDVFELLELDEDDDDEFTNKLLGEWAYEQFDNIPSVGDSFEYDNVAVTVSEMRNNRILRLRVRLIDEGGEEK